MNGQNLIAKKIAGKPYGLQFKSWQWRMEIEIESSSPELANQRIPRGLCQLRSAK
jgi:hypothetical protein